MHNKALQNKDNAEYSTPYEIVVTNIQEFGAETDLVRYFSINLEATSKEGIDYQRFILKGYTVYQILDRIYYRPSEEFDGIMEDSFGEVPGYAVEMLKREALNNNELESYSITDNDMCLFIVSSIFSSLIGDSFDDMNENVKIRRNTSIDAENDPNQSKKVQDIKYGNKDDNDFKQEVEDKQKQDGTVGALDQKQEEAAKPILPNVNLLKESQEIEYEVEDKVIFDGNIWHVFGVIDNLEMGQILRITREGQTRTIPANQVKPDPNQMELLAIEQFDLDEKTRLNKKPENEKPVKMEDLNEQTIPCHIRFNNAILENTVEGEKFQASVKDILEESDPVKVYIGDDIQEVPKEDVIISPEDWVYAVVAGEDDEPVRKIKIDPMSYIDAEEDDLVKCMIGDKLTELPKHVIRTLS